MRLNNLSARLIVNAWLKKTGQKPLSSKLSYEEFAAELRGITASKMVQVPFESRADAVRYIREIASIHRKDV
jgi:hypothetical protein